MPFKQQVTRPLIFLAIGVVCYVMQQAIVTESPDSAMSTRRTLLRASKRELEFIDPSYSAKVHEFVLSHLSSVDDLYNDDIKFPLHPSFKQKALAHEERLNNHKRRRLQTPTPPPVSPPTPDGDSFVNPPLNDDKQYWAVNFLDPISYESARQYCISQIGKDYANYNYKTNGSDLANAYRNQGSGKKRTYKNMLRFDILDAHTIAGKACWVGLEGDVNIFRWSRDPRVPYVELTSVSPYWNGGHPVAPSTDFAVGNCVVVRNYDSGGTTIKEYDVADCEMGPVETSWNIECAICENPCYNRFDHSDDPGGDCVVRR